MKRVYVAGPFFNEAQVRLISKVEMMCRDLGLEFHSPRLHSPSAQFTESQRKDPNTNWDPVIDSNIEKLHWCNLLLCVMDWKLPVTQRVVLETVDNYNSIGCGTDMWKVTCYLNVPDSGTVWELGYNRGLNRGLSGVSLGSVRRSVSEFHQLRRTPAGVIHPSAPSEPSFPKRWTPAVCFYTEKPGKPNLMIGKGCDGVIYGMIQLLRFLSGDGQGSFRWSECRGFEGALE